MTVLTDPFANIHKKDIKNKAGKVVAQVDYVGWSQVADRLDEAAPGWSFEVITLSEDWCLGKLTIDERVYMNVGYAENADMDWKKEPLKDAVSDALKRCAALAGVARYLYDKDTPRPNRTRAPARPAAPTGGSTGSGHPTSTPSANDSGAMSAATTPAGPASDDAPWPAGPVDEAAIAAAQALFPDAVFVDEGGKCPDHGREWRHNRRGYYCSGKLASGAWCDRTPSADWQMAHDVAGVA